MMDPDNKNTPIPISSHFWNCITFSEDCPFFNTTDPSLYYFGLCIMVVYGAFIMMLLGDITFFWSVDKLQNQIDYYINLVKKKIRNVQMDQRRLVSMQDRSLKQLQKSQESSSLVAVLRGALDRNGNPNYFSTLTSYFEELEITQEPGVWSNVEDMADLTF